MTHHRNHRAMPIDPDQFDAVGQGGFRDNARRHNRWFRSAVSVVSQAEAVPYFVEYDVTLQLGSKRGKIVWVNTDQTRAIREGSRPGHALCIDVLSGLVELGGNRGWSEPQPPQNERSGNECSHATDRRSLLPVLRQQIPIEPITCGDQRPHELVKSVRGIT